MRIGFDFVRLYSGKLGGMEQFVRNLVEYLASSTDSEVVIFLTDHNKEYLQENNLIKRVYVPFDSEVFVEIKKEIANRKIDIFVSPFLTVDVKNLGIPNISIFPDTQNFDFPEYFDKETLKHRNNNFNEAIKNADYILTISNFAKKRIMEHSGLDEDKVGYIYLDADKVFYNEMSDEKNKEIIKKYSLPQRYIFYPANTWPHKNHFNLLKAYKEFIKDEKYQDVKLLFTGDNKESHNEIGKKIKEYNLKENVQFLGYIEQEEMPYIYINALYLVNPSRYEGFGIPLIEAMRTGCAVACSNVTSLPEIGQDAVLYFNPNDVNSILTSLKKMMDKKTRDKLIEKGKILQKEYSWEITAQRTFKIFEQLIQQMNNKPLVSIVTPSYNQGQFIEETILSVLNQTYDNIEYIVMDGGSTDNTVEILKKYSDKITWVSENDKGQAHAVDKAIKISKGEIIGWLNSDDTYYEDTVETMVRYFNFNPYVDMFYGEADYIDKQGDIIERYPTKGFSKENLANECYICQPAAFFTRKVYDKVKGIDISLQMCMDYELWMRMSECGVIEYIPEKIATSRLYDENKTLGQRNAVFKEIIKTVQKHYGYVTYNWIYGYVDYLKQTGKIKRKASKGLFILLMVKYNWKKPKSVFAMIVSYLRSIKRVIVRNKNFVGSYVDGWVGKTFIKTYYNISKGLFIKAENQNIRGKNIRIRVFINGKEIDMIEIKCGEVAEKILEIPAEYASKKAEIELRPNKTFCPLIAQGSTDKRILSFILHEIKEVENYGQ